MTFIGSPGRLAGLLYVLRSIVGLFAMAYVPDKLIVHGNAAATVNNIACCAENHLQTVHNGRMGRACRSTATAVSQSTAAITNPAHSKRVEASRISEHAPIPRTVTAPVQ
jgi:hypothetical protein